jgi:KRAB domain-containing zinc finger protein
VRVERVSEEQVAAVRRQSAPPAVPLGYINGNVANALHECKGCGRRMKRLDHMKMHVKLHSTPQPGVLKCLFKSCKLQAFPTYDDIRQHVIVHKENARFRCHLCQKGFTSMSGLEIHEKRHTQVKTFPCYVPGCTFLGKISYDVRQHVLTKHKLVANTCPFCDKIFLKVPDFKYHVRRHETEAPGAIKCLFRKCKQNFGSVPELKQHLAKHQAQRRFSCDQCSAGFNSKQVLAIHVQRHFQFRPFDCEYLGCSYSAKLKNDLVLHMRRVHTTDQC